MIGLSTHHLSSRHLVGTLAAAAIVVIGVWTSAVQATMPAQPDQAGIRQLIDAGRYQEADDAGMKLVASFEASRGPSSLEVAETLDLVLEARRRSGPLAGTANLDLAMRALTIKETRLGPDDPRVSTTLLLVGSARSAARDNAGAKAAIERAIAIREKAFGPDHLEVAAALNALSTVYRDTLNFDAAEEVALRSLPIARKWEQPPGAETADALVTLAFVYRYRRESERAAPLFEETLAIDERLVGPTHPRLVATMLALAAACDDLGDLERARALLGRAARIIESNPSPGGRQAFQMLMMANDLDRQADYPAELRLSERAVAVAERTGGSSSTIFAAALDQLAIAQSRLGDHAAAAKSRERTVALWTAVQGPEGMHVATALHGLAESYEDAGNGEAALGAIDRAIAIPAVTKEPVLFPEILQTKARFLIARDRLDDARVVLERARQVSASAATHNASRNDLAMTLVLLARLERQAGQPSRAVPYYREAIGLYVQNLGPAHPNVADCRTELAGALAETGALDEARQALVSGEEASLDHLRLIARSLTDRRALAYSAERVSGADLAITLATATKARTQQDVEMAWQLVIRGRTVVLDEMAARQRAVVAEAENASVREQWATLNHARTRLANLLIRGPERRSTEEYQALVDRTRAARDEAERRLADISGTFREEQSRAHAGWRDVIDRVPRGSTLVAYVRYTPQSLAPARSASHPVGAYAAFVARAGSPVHVVALGSADEIESAIATWRERIQAEVTSGGLASRRSETRYREAAAALRARLWDPLVPYLGSAKAGSDATVFVVPDAAIHLVDLSTLPTGKAEYLVDAPFTLHYLLAERDLVQPPPAPAGTSLLALGAPDFDRVDRAAVESSSVSTVAANTAQPVTLQAMRGANRSACEALSETTFSPLPATEQEVRHIAKLWRSQDVRLLDGDRATEAAFKTLARGRRVLHLATHGFFLDRACGALPDVAPGSVGKRLSGESPLLRSGLVLAGANRREQMASDEEDGILTAEEIAGLDLSAAQWAVLSACDTGRGDWQAGEGVLGLRRAFQVAGARTVILSLWPVLDTVASDWMAELYRGRFVRGVPTASAVRGASRTLLAQRRAAQQSTHPLYWSGFIATGDWR